ncbi:rRNA-processing protein UTP23-like [Heracleum sosnowskyi]|uniref:rRNA-processing protein UTP23-like n=1 Tax=Heracleum sosnowskyi TaxID=360622 RepID=A0AAD8H1H1_9APIA|nr:rRNA-processing protein UTP23-like [Heracleum sosnowskyi]
MRLKRQKRHRKTVRFFTACFGFRDPFKVLCDGTFIHHLVAHDISPVDTVLANLLGAEVKIFTTRCVLAELGRLGSAYSGSLSAARNIMPARCDHEKRKSAVDCISEIIGENNAEHFFVATQDADMRKKFHEIPGVPLIFGLRNALLLDPLSKSQRYFAKSAEEERLHLNDLELKMLNMKKYSRPVIKAEDTPDMQEGVDQKFLGSKTLKLSGEKKKTDLKDKVQFKRKKAKGPNPLSCKKKKTQGNQNNTPKKEIKDAEQTVRSRSRKRKRSRKSKTVESTINQ